VDLGGVNAGSLGDTGKARPIIAILGKFCYGCF